MPPSPAQKTFLAQVTELQQTLINAEHIQTSLKQAARPDAELWAGRVLQAFAALLVSILQTGTSADARVSIISHLAFDDNFLPIMFRLDRRWKIGRNL